MLAFCPSLVPAALSRVSRAIAGTIVQVMLAWGLIQAGVSVPEVTCEILIHRPTMASRKTLSASDAGGGCEGVAWADIGP